jgi:hypothetical protein
MVRSGPRGHADPLLLSRRPAAIAILRPISPRSKSQGEEKAPDNRREDHEIRAEPAHRSERIVRRARADCSQHSDAKADESRADKATDEHCGLLIPVVPQRVNREQAIMPSRDGGSVLAARRLFDGINGQCEQKFRAIREAFEIRRSGIEDYST